MNSGEDTENLDDNFPDAHLLVVNRWLFHRNCVFFSIGTTPLEYIDTQKKQLVVKAVDYQLIAGSLYKLCADWILRRCVLSHEIPIILDKYHEGVVGGHYIGKATTRKILYVGLWWPTMDRDAKE